MKYLTILTALVNAHPEMLPQVLRLLADYLDAHPEVQKTLLAELAKIA